MKTTKKMSPKDQPRVLAIAPLHVGFGYAVFDHPQHLMDWGLSVVRVNKVSRALLRFDALLELYKPNVIVIDIPDSYWGDTSMAEKLTTVFARRSAVAVLPVKRYERKQLQEFFTIFDALTKEEIADTLVEWLPVLSDYRPQKRAAWESQDMQMRIFDATAAALTFYADYEEESNSLIQK